MNKRLLLSGTLGLLTVFTFAQDAPKKENTFEIQAKGLGNSTWLFNKNISDLGDEQNYANSIGISYGLGFNAYFGKVGVGIEGLVGNHIGSFAGKLEYKDSTGAVLKTTDYKSSITLQTYQIPLMFKLKSDILYFEIGPQYNIISSATYKYSGEGFSMDTVVTSDYASSFISAIVGFGAKIKFGESPLSMNLGLRLQYGLTDLKGVDALGNDLGDALVYKDKSATNAATGGVVLSLNYQIGKKKNK
jgi:hypothetical protein